MAHRHYETFELPEVLDRLLPDRLATTALNDRDGNIVSLSAALEPMVKDIVFARLAAGECTDAAFHERCVGSFTHRMTLRRRTSLARNQRCSTTCAGFGKTGTGRCWPYRNI
jgi:hypothetical protein